jgi:type IV pilus assembly protein PilC
MDQSEEWMERARCRPLTLAVITRQLSVMFRQGVPLTEALECLKDADDPRFKPVALKLSSLLAEGYTFSKALSLFPKVFDRVFVVMVRVGENTGQLSSTLEALADWLERDHNWKQKLKSAFTYPIFVLALTFFMTWMLFHSVMPGFLKIFTDMNLELPLITQALVSITHAARNPGVWVVALAGIGFFTFTLHEYGQTRRGSVFLYQWLMVVPGLGRLAQSATTARYAFCMNTLIRGGADLLRSLQMAAEVSQNPLMIADAENMRENVSAGEKVSEHMNSRPEVYPNILAQMTRAGEESARMGTMYGNVADFYSQEVDHMVESLGAALEPLLLTLVATVVGIVLVGLFLPLYGSLSNLGV